MAVRLAATTAQPRASGKPEMPASPGVFD